MHAVKLTGDDRIEGLAIPFGGPLSGNDLDGERFTAQTDLALDWYPNGRPLLYEHGKDSTLGVQVVGRQVSVKQTEEGMWAEAQLNRAHRYAEHIRELVAAGKLFFSSGSVGHLVERAGEKITRWPFVELSLTPTPANPYAVASAKSAIAAAKSLGLDVPAALVDPTTVDAATGALADRIAEAVLTKQATAREAEAASMKTRDAERRYLSALADAHLLLAGGGA